MVRLLLVPVDIAASVAVIFSNCFFTSTLGIEWFAQTKLRVRSKQTVLEVERELAEPGSGGDSLGAVVLRSSGTRNPCQTAHFHNFHSCFWFSKLPRAGVKGRVS